MDSRKTKRSKLSFENEDFWECSVCTYKNRAELYKCDMCDVRKGTSTRRPRLTQVTQKFAKLEHQLEEERKKDRRREVLKSRAKNYKASNANLSNGQTLSITVNGLTVFITDYEVSNCSSEGLSDIAKISKTQKSRKTRAKTNGHTKANKTNEQSDAESGVTSDDDENGHESAQSSSDQDSISENASGHESDPEGSHNSSSASTSNKSSSKIVRSSNTKCSSVSSPKKRVNSRREPSKAAKVGPKKLPISSTGGKTEHNSSNPRYVNKMDLPPPTVPHLRKNEAP